ncbi:hypothetical protein [Zavarzinia sp.]|uniref:hypothetical protein n=1 Tax=Zavarzinia sp. TaxID=2027920 RepID=UPI003567535B
MWRQTDAAGPETGATALEYIFIASIISIAAMVGMAAIGGKLENYFESFANAFN